MDSVLEIDGVQLSFGQRDILKSVYLKAETGKITGILGRNGCGKSCLLKIIFGELTAQDKSLRIDGKVLHGHSRNPEDVKMLPQFNFMPKYLRVTQAFEYFRLEFAEFCALFPEFEEYRELKIRALAGGNIRIMETYMILKSHTRFAILDEPFSHLSPKNSDIFIELIKQEKQNKGIIITDHLYRRIVEVSDWLYVIRDGSSYRIKGPEELVRYGYLRV